MKTIVYILCLFLLFGCEDDIPQDSNLILYNTTSQIEHDGKVYSIEFADIVENSICPKDVVCVWQGRFVAQLNINGNEYFIGLGDLNASEYSSEIIIDDVKITLTEIHGEEAAVSTLIKLELTSV